jgi:RNA recognition motif-containing protein
MAKICLSAIEQVWLNFFKSMAVERENRMNIYVGNLAYSVKDDELQQAFLAYGEVESAKVIVDRDSGRSKGFGFVEMAKQEEAEAAIESLNGHELQGRKLTVNESRPKPRNNNSRHRPGGGNRY